MVNVLTHGDEKYNKKRRKKKCKSKKKKWKLKISHRNKKQTKRKPEDKRYLLIKYTYYIDVLLTNTIFIGSGKFPSSKRKRTKCF
jgi:hypothetical protein